MAANTKLTDSTEQLILDGVRLGGLMPDIANHAGIGERTIYRWLERGKRYKEAEEVGALPQESDKRYYEFTQRFLDGVSSVRLRMTGKILQAADGDAAIGKDPDWKAAAWYLERSAPALWGRRLVPEEAVAQGEQANIEQMTKEAIAIVDQIRLRRETAEAVVPQGDSGAN
jgi:hypothetical protein